MHEVLFVPNPNNTQLSNILAWAKSINENNDVEGFCHLDMIEKGYQKKELATLVFKNEVVSYIHYQLRESYIILDHIVTKPEHRKKGFAIKLLSSLLASKDVAVAEAFCSPKETFEIWKRINFIELPMHVHRSEQLFIYKTIKKTLPLYLKTELNPQKEYVCVYDCDYRESRIEKPKWVWELEFVENSRVLKHPIILAEHYNLKIQHIKKSCILQESSIERISFNDARYSNYLIVSEL